jgi:hypothetical protein
MEKIMSKTDHASRLTRLEDHDTLEDTELDAVTGGAEFVITKLMDVSISGGGGDGGGGGSGSSGPADAWNKCLRGYGYPPMA